jgi:hypothetical protein
LTYNEKAADLADDENRRTPAFLEEIDSCRDEVVDAGAQGLVTTGLARTVTLPLPAS